VQFNTHLESVLHDEQICCAGVEVSFVSAEAGPCSAGGLASLDELGQSELQQSLSKSSVAASQWCTRQQQVYAALNFIFRKHSDSAGFCRWRPRVT